MTVYSALRVGFVLKDYCWLVLVTDLILTAARSPMIRHSVVPTTDVLPWRTGRCRSSLGKRCWGVFFFVEGECAAVGMTCFSSGQATNTSVYLNGLHENLSHNRRDHLDWRKWKWFVVLQNKYWIRACGYRQGIQMSRSFPPELRVYLTWSVISWEYPYQIIPLLGSLSSLE